VGMSVLLFGPFSRRYHRKFFSRGPRANNAMI
jgi:hypothetical protein